MTGSFTDGTGISSSIIFFTVLSSVGITVRSRFVVSILTCGTRISGFTEKFTSRNSSNFITTGGTFQIVSSIVTFSTFISSRVPFFTAGGSSVGSTRLVF